MDKVKETPTEQADFFPMGALQVLGAIEGKTPEEMAESLLEQEKKLKEDYERGRTRAK